MILKILITFLVIKDSKASTFEILSKDIPSEKNLIEKFHSFSRIQCIVKCLSINDCRFLKHFKNECCLYSPYGQLDFVDSYSIRIYQQLKFMNLNGLIIHWIFSESHSIDLINNFRIEHVNAFFVPDRNNKAKSAIQFSAGHLKVPTAGYYFFSTFTCLVWLKIITWAPKLTLFEFGNGLEGDYVKFGLTGPSNSKSFLSISANRLNDRDILFLPDDLLIGVWHHLALTFDSKNIGSIYLNGSLVASKQFNFNPLKIFRKENYIGKGSSGNEGNYLIVDDLRIYIKSLNQEQILEQMNETI